MVGDEREQRESEQNWNGALSFVGKFLMKRCWTGLRIYSGYAGQMKSLRL